MVFNLQTCARPNILSLKPYRCARDDYKDDGTNVLLDANENAYGPSLPLDTDGRLKNSSSSSNPATSAIGGGDVELNFKGLNRYPDPHQHDLKSLFCKLRQPANAEHKKLTPDNLFVGVGSDEAIDALLRCFCIPGKDKILTCPPTYGMYSVSAQINDIDVVKVPLLTTTSDGSSSSSSSFDVDVPTILSTITNQENNIKMVYLCSPGNPTGKLIPAETVKAILDDSQKSSWNGIVVLDEAYIDFATDEGSSLAYLVNSYQNLVVMQTLSKAFGLAGIRLGVAFCSTPVAGLLNNLKAPYNISSITSQLAMAALSPAGLEVQRGNVGKILEQRKRLLNYLPKISGVGEFLGGTDANFLLVRMLDVDVKPDNEVAKKVYERMAEVRGVVVRFRGNEWGCYGALRITVGTEEENTRLLEELARVLKEVRGV